MEAMIDITKPVKCKDGSRAEIFCAKDGLIYGRYYDEQNKFWSAADWGMDGTHYHQVCERIESTKDLVQQTTAKKGETMTELKPCPFCGTKAFIKTRLANNSTGFTAKAMCGNPHCFVDCETWECSGMQQAANFWNERWKGCLDVEDIRHLITRLETVVDLLRRNEKHMAMAKILADISALKSNTSEP